MRIFALAACLMMLAPALAPAEPCSKGKGEAKAAEAKKEAPEAKPKAKAKPAEAQQARLPMIEKKGRGVYQYSGD